MHKEQNDFVASVRQRFPAAFDHTMVLEVGSYNVNGSVRQFFLEPTLYIGIDLAPGKDVDIVCSGHEYNPTLRFDVVISTECFEHDPNWYYTFINMHRLCNPQGLVIFTCAAANRHEHGTPRTSPTDSALATDYYKNLNVLDFETSYPLRTMFSDYMFQARENDLYFSGIKR
jgi:SAM-dependent methyltransferase